MNSLIKYLFAFLVLMLLLAMAGYIGYRWQNTDHRQVVQSGVVMERIKNIRELALVEAQLSEIYDYKDYWGIDMSPFRKKALILVKGKVKAGFQLDDMRIIWDLDRHRVLIDSIPEVRILSVDHDLQYYDLQEGSFNGFDAQKLTELNDGAKKFLTKKAISDQILIKAENRQGVFLEEMKAMLIQAGWEVDMASNAWKD